jgi:hypothetical protein
LSIESLSNEPPTETEAWNRYARSEIRLHTLFFGMAAIVLLMSLLMTSQGERTVFLPGFRSAMPETCTSRRIFGIECPGCGMTRAFISISHGQFSRAWQFNRASFVVYFFVAVQIPWHSIQIWRLKRNRRPIQWPYVYLLPIAVVVVMTVNWLWNLSQLV